MENQTYCKHCYKPIIPQRKNKVFCSATCRAADHNENKWYDDFIRKHIYYKYTHSVIVNLKNIPNSLKAMPLRIKKELLPNIIESIRKRETGKPFKNGTSIRYSPDKNHTVELIRTDDGTYIVRW